MWAGGRWGAAALVLGLLLLLVPGNVSLFSHRLALPTSCPQGVHSPAIVVCSIAQHIGRKAVSRTTDS